MNNETKAVDVSAVLVQAINAATINARTHPSSEILAAHRDVLIAAKGAIEDLIDMACIAEEALSARGISLSRGDGLTLGAAISRMGGAK